MVDNESTNLLHSLVRGILIVRRKPSLKPCSDFMDNLRLLIRLIPGGTFAENDEGYTPYDLFDPENPELLYLLARRLLLMAGAPTLYPEERIQMNYESRKYALFVFFGDCTTTAEEPNIFYRISHGAAGDVMMRLIVSYL